MAANEELKDHQITRIAVKISSKSLKMVAVTYRMGIEQTDLDNVTMSAFGNEQEVIREILGKWKHKTAAMVQVFKTLWEE